MSLPEIPPNFDTLFLEWLAEEKDVLSRTTMKGSCADHGRYMFYAGQHVGLSLAEAKFNELVAAWKNRE